LRDAYLARVCEAAVMVRVVALAIWADTARDVTGDDPVSHVGIAA
jgi:hypothetical protein